MLKTTNSGMPAPRRPTSSLFGGTPPLPHLPVPDLAVLSFYLLATTALGCWFALRNRTSEHFMSAGRSLPGWAVGLSIFGSYVSSISFLANPGKSYGGDWNAFVFAVSLPLAAWMAVRWFVPFYRRAGEVSAYHHLEHRFGPWARTYAVVCFLLTQLARLGTIMYLLALALQPLVGWDVRLIIVVAGVLITIYPFLGGTEAVIWTGVVQALVLVTGPILCIVVLLLGMPGGPGELMAVASSADKFSLGSPSFDLTRSTIWVVLLYGLVTNLQNFGIDQSYVQRYITARSDADARRSIWLGALLYIPIGAAFFFIGSALFAYYQVQPALLPPNLKSDAVFPHFIGHQLPPGMAGLVVAAICAAAMDSNLNCCATLYLCDIHRRYFRPGASEGEAMLVLRTTTVVMGTLSTVAALAMIQVKSALDTWWELAGIFSGGMLGLFLLGILFPRAGNRAGFVGALAGVLVILWMTLSPKWDSFPAAWRSPFHNLLVMVFGTLTILTVGAIASRFEPIPRPRRHEGG